MLLTTCALSSPAIALDGYSVDVGKGDLATLYKVAVHQSFGKESAWLQACQCDGYWEASVATITEEKYRNIQADKRSLMDFGWTPVLRWHGRSARGLFVELGVGIHYFSEIYDNNNRLLGSEFQFGDHIGVGYQFSHHLELTLKFQHFSDAGIKEPNPGLNMTVLKVALLF